MSRMGSTVTYVYCLVDAPGWPPDVSNMPARLPGLGKSRLLPLGRRGWLVVADAPTARYGEAALEVRLQNMAWLSRCALAHQAVVAHCLSAAAVVPMKLFTIFEDDDRALAGIARRGKALDRIIRRVRNRVEWGVRIRGVPAARPPRPQARPATGTGYLTARKRARDTARQRRSRSRSEVEGAFRLLARVAAEARHREMPGGRESRLLMDAAFLVGAADASRFRAAVRKLSRTLERGACSVEVTGPWPPYNFIES